MVTEIVLLPSLDDAGGDLESNELSRRKRAYEPDVTIKFDKIGQPRGIPEKFKAQNEIAAGFEAIIPAI